MIHFMADLETVDTAPTAAILSIALVEFDPLTGAIGQRYYRNVDLVSCLDAGLTYSEETIKWWDSQSAASKNVLNENKLDITSAMRELSAFITSFSGLGSNIAVWGNGAAFDNVILRNAFKAVGMVAPWDFRNDFDVRTLVHLCETFVKRDQFPHVGVAHYALDDAIAQIKYVAPMYAHLKYGLLSLSQQTQLPIAQLSGHA